MRRDWWIDLLALVGAALVVAGIGWIYRPAGVIAGGLALLGCAVLVAQTQEAGGMGRDARARKDELDRAGIGDHAAEHREAG